MLNIIDITAELYKEYENEIKSKEKKVKTSQYIGVRMKSEGRFTAQIYVDKKNKYIGIYDNEYDAAKAYNIEAKLANKKYGENYKKINVFEDD